MPHIEPHEKKPPASYGVSVNDLIGANLIRPPLPVTQKYLGCEVTAQIEADGRVTFDGRTYDSLSEAAGMARVSVKGAPPPPRKVATEYVVDTETGKGHWEVYDPAAGFLPPVEPEGGEVVLLHPKTKEPFTKTTKPCDLCGEEFEPKSKRARFCKSECRNAARRKTKPGDDS